MSQFSELFERLIAPHYPQSAEQVRLLAAHYALLLRWNQRINLTAITKPEEVLLRHYGESLALAAAIPAGAWQIVDAGSGAGFPGVPLAIARPECRVTMVEIDIRKGVFIKESTVDVPNAFVRSERLSTFEPGCDWLVSRALHRQELIPYAEVHGCSVALLLSDDQIADTLSDWRSLVWQPPMPLPWKGQGSILIGESPTQSIV